MGIQTTLNFYNGWSSTNRIWTLSKSSNMIAQDSVLYPYPYYIINANFTPISTVNGLLISDKVYNSSIKDPAANLEAIFLLAQGESPTNALDIDTWIGRKGEMEQNEMGYTTFSFTYTSALTFSGDVGLGGGLTSFSVNWNRDSNRMWGAYINTIFEINNGFIVQDVIELTNDTISITELSVDSAGTPRIFIITDQQFYQIDSGTGDETLIENEMSDLTGLSASTVASNIVWITGIRDGVDSIGIYNTATQLFAYHANPRNQVDGRNVAINRVFYDSPFARMILCTDDGAVFMNPVTGAVEDTFITGKQVFDVDTPGGGQFYNQIYATSNGLHYFNDNIDGTFSTGIFKRVAVRGDAGGQSIFGAAVRGEDQSHEIMAFFGESDNTFTTSNYGNAEFFTDIESFGYEAEPDNVSEWFSGSIGTGFWSGLFFNTSGGGTPQPASLRFRRYTQKIRDIVKRTEDRLTYLVSLIGSSDTDSNSVLVEYDRTKDELFSGEMGGFVPMDRLWIAGDTFLTRNSETKSIFYYRTTNGLGLQTLNNSNDFGQLETTFAGTIVDILPYDDIFYIFGSLGIEVWQNTGAAGFPFRKQPFLSLAYHAPPSSVNNNYRFPVKYWDYFNDGFVVICYSNQANQLAILKLNGGHGEPLPIDWRKFYNILNILGETPTTVVDYGIGVQNLWGKNYIGISLITDLTTGISPQTIFLDQNLNFFTIDDLLSTYQTFFFMMTATNGLNLFYDNIADEIKVDTASQFPISVPSGNTYFADSQVLAIEGTIIEIEKLIFEVAFPIADEANYPPEATYEILISSDEGRNFQVVRTGSFITAIQTIVEKNLGSYTSALIRFKVDTPIILVNGKAIVNKKGAS